MRVYIATLMALIALVGGPNAAVAQEAGEPARGLRVALRLCAECHAVRRNEQQSPKLTAPPFTRIANMPGMTALALNHLLHSSHETMPNIMIPPEEQWHLVAYILSLRSR
jgi:cytochrome c